MIHVGMDLHHRMAYVRAITEDGELHPGRRVYLNDLRRLWEYLDAFGDEPVRIVLEAVSNARWMYRLLGRRGNVEPVVVTPHKVRVIAETVAKTDKIDAEKLALLSKIDMLPVAWMPDERVEQLRELVRHRAKQVRTRTRCKNEVNGVLVRCGLQRPHQDIFGWRCWIWPSNRSVSWTGGFTRRSPRMHPGGPTRSYSGRSPGWGRCRSPRFWLSWATMAAFAVAPKWRRTPG